MILEGREWNYRQDIPDNFIWRRSVMNRIVDYISLILGQDNETRYPELYKSEDLPGTRNSYFDPIVGGPYNRAETRSINWKAL
jgi:hypothetical protein